MSTLYIREFEALPVGVQGGTPQIWMEPGTDQTPVTYTGTHGRSAAFAAGTKFITITSDGIFSYKVGGSTVAATTSALRVPAGTFLSIGVKPGDYISAITNT